MFGPCHRCHSRYGGRKFLPSRGYFACKRCGIVICRQHGRLKDPGVRHGGVIICIYIYICSLISRYKFILHIYISELFAVELEGTTLSCMDPILLVYNCSLLRLAPEKLRNKLCGLHDAVVVRGPWFSRLFLGDCRLKRAIHKKDMF